MGNMNFLVRKSQHKENFRKKNIYVTKKSGFKI